MSCSPIHLKDYLLHELADPERRTLEVHLRTCAACREELDRLRLTEAALFSLRDEEIPQRIAFVSDPVFEPSPWRRWWSGLWASPARLGFFSAAMLSAAILVSAFARPAVWTAPARIQPAPAAIRAAATEPALSSAEIDQRIQTAVAKAVSASQEAQTQRVRQLIAEVEQSRQQLKVAAVELDWSQRRMDNIRYTAYAPPVRTAGGEQK